MKYTFKRWFAGLLSVVIVLTLLPVSALESEGQSSDSPYVIGNDTGQDPVPIDSDGTLEDGGFTCDLNGSTLTINGSGELAASDVSQFKDEVEEVIIGEGITSIRAECFSGWTNLTRVSLPKTLQIIDYEAFWECSALVLTELPSGVAFLGSRAFGDCANLALKELPEGLKIIESQAFCYCSSLALTAIPDGVTSIGSQAFQSCTNITSLTLPASLQELGSLVFYDSSITSLTFLGENAPTVSTMPSTFIGADALTEILYPAGASGYDSEHGWPTEGVEKKAGYKVTVEPADNGTASASSALALKGAKIILTAVPAEGYHLTRWNASPGVEIEKSDNSFSMPEYDVAVTPVFEQHTFTNGKCSVCGKLIFEGSGIENDPYIIPDFSTLKMFQEYINNGYGENEYFQLKNDIDLENEPWTPIGTETKQFKGTFNGDNHTISGLKITSGNNQGLFGVIGDSGTAKNLTVEGSVTGNENVGGIAGHSYGNIENCHNTATIQGKEFVGGIVGKMDGGASVQNCSNTSTVNGGRDAGGIAGQGDGTIVNCYNAGDVNSTGSMVGGIAGYLYGGTVKNCYNVGKIKGIFSTGGVVGNPNRKTVESCYNYGVVDATTGGPVVGVNSCSNCFYLDTTWVKGGRDAVSKSDEQFASGEVAWLLQNGQEEETQVWGQTVGEGYPELTEEAYKHVYKVTFAMNGNEEYAAGYANHHGTVSLPEEPTLSGMIFDHWSQTELS